MAALKIIMENNICCFGDTTWLQTDDTAIGALSVIVWTIIYFFTHEKVLLPKFLELVFYKRWIDNSLGLWVCHPSPIIDNLYWETLKFSVKYGKLIWGITNCSNKVNLLDLTTSINNRSISTKIYEKPNNFYLYLPPHLCHAPSKFTSYITSAMQHIIKLTTNREQRDNNILKYYHRL